MAGAPDLSYMMEHVMQLLCWLGWGAASTLRKTRRGLGGKPVKTQPFAPEGKLGWGWAASPADDRPAECWKES